MCGTNLDGEFADMDVVEEGEADMHYRCVPLESESSESEDEEGIVFIDI